MKSTGIAALAVYGILAATLGGCHQPGDEGPSRVAARRNAYVEDVPVPFDFSLNERRSMTKVYPNMANTQIRIIDHYYEGSGQVGAVRNFYLERMPEQGWSMLKEELKEGVYALKFRKRQEFCEVRIRRGGSEGLFDPIEIRVQLEPETDSVGSPQ